MQNIINFGITIRILIFLVAKLNPSDFGILVMNNRYLSFPVVAPGYEFNWKRLKNLIGQGRLYVQVRGFKASAFKA